MLLVNPLAFRGISRRQWECVRRFVADPPEGPVVIYSDTMHEDGVAADRLHDIDRLPDMSEHRGSAVRDPAQQRSLPAVRARAGLAIPA